MTQRDSRCETPPLAWTPRSADSRVPNARAAHDLAHELLNARLQGHSGGDAARLTKWVNETLAGADPAAPWLPVAKRSVTTAISAAVGIAAAALELAATEMRVREPQQLLDLLLRIVDDIAPPEEHQTVSSA